MEQEQQNIKQQELEENYEEVKAKEQKELHAQNLLQEASETINQCTECGQCKGLCPVFKSMRMEHVSPRGHATILSEKIIRESLFLCTMCKACEQQCPMNLKVCDAIAKAREALALRDQGLQSNETMMKNLREIGNPFVKNN